MAISTKTSITEKITLCAKCGHKPEHHAMIETFRGIMYECKRKGCECCFQSNMQKWARVVVKEQD